MQKIDRTELVKANISGGGSHKGKQQPPSTTVNVTVNVTNTNGAPTPAPV
ncbi:MAG: hypothetical protein LWW84_02360 [Azovibrio sp.]|nr:hypothetical protein [Azovibrio sp.]